MAGKERPDNQILGQAEIKLNPSSGQIYVGEGAVPFAERVWKITIVSALFFALFHQELFKLFQTWGTANESHGMLIPAFSLYFVYQVRQRLRETRGRPCYAGILVMMLSLVGYFLSLQYRIGYSRPLMMILMIGGLVLFLGGWPIVRLVWLPVVFLVFAIKLPGGLHERITIPMREMASSVAAIILNFLPGVKCEATGVLIQGMHAFRQGSELIEEPFSLNVAEACSGMRLLRTFVALGVAMAYLEYRPLVHRLVLLFSTVPIAILCNMIRVLLTGLVHLYIGSEYAQGTLHTLMGMLMLLVAFGFYGGIAWILNNLYVDEHQEEEILMVSRFADPEGKRE